MYIYCIYNKINGKMYIGKSQRRVGEREDEHFRKALSGSTNSRYFYNAIRHHGKDSFGCCTLSGYAESDDDLVAQEIYYIKKYQTNKEQFGYNMTAGGEGAAGRKHSSEAKEKIRRARMGSKASAVTKQKMSETRKGKKPAACRFYGVGEKNPMYGKSPSQQTREKMCKSHKKAWQNCSDERRKAQSELMKTLNARRWLNEL
jgi:group I intron endonuclease